MSIKNVSKRKADTVFLLSSGQTYSLPLTV